MVELYKRIEALCKSQGITITEMCRRSGVPRANLSELKMGRQQTLGISSLEKLAAYFNVELGYFSGDEENKKQPLEYEGLSPTAIQIAKLADRLPPEYLPAALALIESLERAIPNPGGGEQSQ